MSQWKSADEILDFAVGNEEKAIEFVEPLGLEMPAGF